MFLRRHDLDYLALRLDGMAAKLRCEGLASDANDVAIAAEMVRESACRMGGHEFGPEKDRDWRCTLTMKEVVVRA